MPIMTVTAAIAGLKNTIDLAKAAIAARDDLKLAEMQQSINDRVIDVQNAALALQEKQSAARDEIDELKEQLRAANAKISELDRKRTVREQYVLEELAEGVFALASIDPDTSDHPPHYVCQPCMDNNSVTAILQQTGKYGTIKLKCPVCSTEYRTGEHVPPPPVNIGGRNGYNW
ncbi:hypothetical protein [Burkholderia stagnalis]|nr:hypothetical protein [Burkholderia stagnalis]KWD07206.1 hypothetical protein WT45_03170 [Burkholderia stagnalis]KWH75795.1 hypothetical protein WT64_11045 [Burkholderia stagnalis]